MNNINESKKEPLPTTFLTTFVSDGWNTISRLRSDIEAIKKEFTGTKKAEAILDSLITAYLVAVGQAEACLENKNYLDFSRDEMLSGEELDSNTKSLGITEMLQITQPTQAVRNEPSVNSSDKEVFNKAILSEEETAEKCQVADSEYFVDFDEPVGNKLTDDDLYENNN